MPLSAPVFDCNKDSFAVERLAVTVPHRNILHIQHNYWLFLGIYLSCLVLKSYGRRILSFFKLLMRFDYSQTLIFFEFRYRFFIIFFCSNTRRFPLAQSSWTSIKYEVCLDFLFVQVFLDLFQYCIFKCQQDLCELLAFWGTFSAKRIFTFAFFFLCLSLEPP